MAERCECGHMKGQHAKGQGECYAGVRPSGEPMEEGRDYTQVQCSCPAFVPAASGEQAKVIGAAQHIPCGTSYITAPSPAPEQGSEHRFRCDWCGKPVPDAGRGQMYVIDVHLNEDAYQALGMGDDFICPACFAAIERLRQGGVVLPADVVEGVKENIVASLNTARDQVENVLLSDYERIHMGDIVRRLEAVLALLPEGGERMLTDNQIRAATRGGKLGLVAVEDGDGFKEMTNVEYLGGEVLRVREELRRYYNIEIELKERLTAIEALPEKWEAQAVNEDTARTEAADNYAAACRMCARELEQAVKGEG